MSISGAAMDRLLTPDLLNRSAPDLQVEHSYLLHGLAIVSQKANGLLRRIPPLEKYLKDDSHTTKEKRKTRKQLGWLKCRLAEASRQEQILHQRLGQLACEMQQRQRLILLEVESRMYSQQSYSFSSTSSKTAYLQLDPTAPEFVPVKQFWMTPGVKSLHISQKACAPRSIFYGGIDDIVMKVPSKESMPSTIHFEDIDQKVMDTGIFNSGSVSVTVDDASQTSTSTNGFDRFPLIVHRSSSTSDLTSSFSSDRRNSLPSPTDLENYARLDCEQSWL